VVEMVRMVGSGEKMFEVILIMEKPFHLVVDFPSPTFLVLLMHAFVSNNKTPRASPRAFKAKVQQNSVTENFNDFQF
jgi:hypothetical protein